MATKRGANDSSPEAATGHRSKRMKGLDPDDPGNAMENFIIDNYVNLTKRLEVEKVYPYLIQWRILSLDEKERIQNKETERAKVEELLSTLSRSGKCTPEQLISILHETHQTTLIDSLTSVDGQRWALFHVERSMTLNVLPAKLQLEFVQKAKKKLLRKADKLFDKETLKDEKRLKEADEIFAKYKARIESLIPRGCFVVNLTFLQPCDVDDFYHDHFRVGPGSLSAALSDLLITDEMRAVVGGEELMVRVEVRHDDYIRVRRRLCTTGLQRSTSVDDLSVMLLPPKETEIRSVLNSLDLATNGSRDSRFTDRVTEICTKQLTLKMKKMSQALTGLEAKHEIAQRQVELQEGMVKGLQGEVKRLTQEQETAQKLLLDNKKEIEDLTGANKSMKDTIEELLAEKTKLTNRLAMILEERQFPHRRAAGEARRAAGEAGASGKTLPTTARQEVISILLVNDEYGTSHRGVSTVNRQVAQFLVRHGATVHSTALQASEQDKRCAEEDGVILHLPVRNPRQKRTPSFEWLTDYHSIHYPDIPQDLKCIVGYVDVTSGAAKSIQETRCRHARLVLFNHDMPEDTEHYKGAKKAMAAGKKVGDILEDTKNADAVFSLGRRIFDHFEAKYKSLGESKSNQHFVFLPRPSATFEAISVRPGGGQKVVLTAGRVTEVERLKGHDLAARAMGEVAEKIPNVTLRVRGIDEDDWEASQKILEENLQSGRIKPTLLPCGTQEDIAQDMQQAHLVLMPSRAEPFGMIGLEAIAAGIPVLISDKSGLADMITDLIDQNKCPADMRHRIVETSVNESDLDEAAKEWAKRIVDTLKYSTSEFEKAAEFKKKLLESKYWEESHQNLLRVCGLNKDQ